MNILRFCTLSLAFGIAVFGQSDRGTITGTIADQAGAMVPTANVVAKNIETGGQYSTVSTATGNYTIGQLPAGMYELSVEATGFSKAVQQGLRVQVAQTARIDIVLQLGATTQSVTVTSEVPLLKTEGAEQSHNITSERMAALPLNFSGFGPGNIRNPYSFVTLLPGASITSSGTSYNIRMNGAPNATQTVRLEGQEANNTISPGNVHQIAPSVEALEEVSVQTSNFSAEYGQVSGGMFNFTTKSGTNSFHGTAYGYLVNEVLNAGIPFTSGSDGLVRPRSRKFDYGFTFGGPVWIPKVYNGRDRTFFFFNYEGYRQREQVSGTLQTLPTEAFRNGDFSSLLTGRILNTDPLGRNIMENAIYDPLTTRTVNGQVVRDPFLNNIIPADRFDPVAAKIQALIPKPTRPGNINNWDQSYPIVRDQGIPSIKIDHSLNSKTKISFFYTRYQTHHYTGADGLPDELTALRYILINAKTYRLNVDYSVSPTLLIHAGVGALPYIGDDIGIDPAVTYDARGKLGLIGGASPGFPRLAGLNSTFGGMSLSMGPTNFNHYRTDKPTAVLSATYIRNSHSYKLGGEFRNDSNVDRNSRQGSGVFNFTGTTSGLPSTNGQPLNGGAVGFPYASFLLGQVNTATVAGYQDPQLRKNSWTLFAQDNWKVTRKLTLDLGLRWDYQEAAHEIHYRTSVFDPNVRNPSAGNLLGAVGYEGYGPGRCNCRYTSTYPYAIGPRVGAAYQIDSKTVFRAGWGISYGTTAAFNYITNTAQVGVGFNILNFTAPGFGEPTTTLREGLKYDPAALYNASYDPGLRPSPGQIDSPPYWLDPNAGRPARVSQWSIGLQRQVTTNLVVEAAYVGNRGAWYQANSLIDINGVTQEALSARGFDLSRAADRTLLTSQIGSTTAQAAGYRIPYPSFPSTQPVAQLLRPYPQFGNITVQWAPLGKTWYDSLQVKATKRYSHGLDLTAAFTWQKELTLGAESQNGGGASINDVYNRPNQKSISASSQPFVLVTGFNYRLPSWGSRKFLRNAVKDWTIGGILRYGSGYPIAVPTAQNGLAAQILRANGGTRANRVAGEPLFTKDLNCGCIDPNKDFVLNPKAWADPAPGAWGTSAAYYNDYRSARRPDEQLTIGRIFQLRERMSFQIRAEFFNVFNRTYLNNPTSNNALQAQARNAAGVPTSGFGRIDSGSVANAPRNGQIVARFTF